jgi:hypothetical protein
MRQDAGGSCRQRIRIGPDAYLLGEDFARSAEEQPPENFGHFFGDQNGVVEHAEPAADSDVG